VAVGPWLGWWPLAALGVAAVGFAVADRRTLRSPRPEYWMAGAWAASVLVIGLTVVETGGALSPLLPWIGLPVTTLGARFATRGVVAGVILTTIVTLAAAASRNAG